MQSGDSNELMHDEETSSENGSDDYPSLPNVNGSTPWTYTMRRHMQEVVPGLYLGPYSAASRSQLDTLLDHGVTHIVCVRQDIEANFIKPNFPDKFRYLVLNIADKHTENIIQHFSKVKLFIDECLNFGGHVLVHGNAGISRSAALVLAYIMETYGLPRTRAFALVQQRRFCINPNKGFMIQLKEYEPIYQAQRASRRGQEGCTRQTSKRTIHQTDTERMDCDTMDS